MNNYSFYNPNPSGKTVGDCVIRAVSKALNKSWLEAYIELCIQGIMMTDLPSCNAVWGRYLKEHGFIYEPVQDYPEAYNIKCFAKKFNKGIYVVGTGTHAVCVENGIIYDSWYSGDEIPIYYYKKEF